MKGVVDTEETVTAGRVAHTPSEIVWAPSFPKEHRVPAGVTRVAEEAARLERHRSGGQDIPKGQQDAAAGFAKALEGKK